MHTAVAAAHAGPACGAVQTHTFASVLRSSLSSIALGRLSMVLSRSPRLKLTPADHDFLRPPGSAPSKGRRCRADSAAAS
jgi:hypothetical protein